MKPEKNVEQQIDPLTLQPVILEVEIATEFHGADPYMFTMKSQKRALKTASKMGNPVFVATLVALLPLELRSAAGKGCARAALADSVSYARPAVEKLQ